MVILLSKQSFLHGTIILLIAGFITRILGFINRIFLARLLGEEGIGLYMMAFPTFILVVSLTQLGLPVAIAKQVAAAQAINDTYKIKKILSVSLWITSLLAIIFTTFLLFTSPILTNTLLTDKRTLYPILAITPVIPLIAISSVLRGYFQGIQNMKPSAVSQVIEQIVRIGLVSICTSILLPFGIEYGAAGAMISIIFGELASLLYMIIIFKKKKNFTFRSNFFNDVKGSKNIFIELMQIALPTTGSRFIGSISYFFEPIVVAQSLTLAGVTSVIATKQYGELAGYAMPLLLLPTFITFALSTSLVPAISEAVAQKNTRLIEHRIQQTIRSMLLIGGWSTVIMYTFASPLLQLMYGSDNAAIYIQIMAPCFLFFYLQAPFQSILQSIDLATVSMINSLVGNIVKIICIFVLASQPVLQGKGVALAICIGMLTTTLLHFATLLKNLHFTIYIRYFIFTILICIFTIIYGTFQFQNIIISSSLLSQTIFSIFTISILYLILCTFTGILNYKEIKYFISIKKLLSIQKK